MAHQSLNQLPVELLELVFDDLSMADLWNLSQVCHYLLRATLPRIIRQYNPRLKALAAHIAQGTVDESPPVNGRQKVAIPVHVRKDITPILRALSLSLPHTLSSQPLSIACALQPHFSTMMHNISQLQTIFDRVSELRFVILNFTEFMTSEYGNPISTLEASQLSEELNRLLVQIMKKGCQQLILRGGSIRWGEKKPALTTTEALGRVSKIFQFPSFRLFNPGSSRTTPSAGPAESITATPSVLKKLVASSPVLSDPLLRSTILECIHNSTSTLIKLTIQLPPDKDGKSALHRSTFDQITLPSLLSFTIYDTSDTRGEALTDFLGRHPNLVRLDIGQAILRFIPKGNGPPRDTFLTHKLPKLETLVCGTGSLPYFLGHTEDCLPNLKELIMDWRFQIYETDANAPVVHIRPRLESIPNICVRSYLFGVRFQNVTTQPYPPPFLRTLVTKLDLCLGILTSPEIRWDVSDTLQRWMAFTNTKVLAFCSPAIPWKFSNSIDEEALDSGGDLEVENFGVDWDVNEDRGIDPNKLDRLIESVAENWKGIEKVRVDEKVIDLKEMRKRRRLEKVKI